MQERLLKMKPAINVNQWLNEGKVSLFHVVTGILSLGVITFDGYNLFVYAGVLPLIMKELNISPTQVGAIASYTLLGAAFGSLVLGSIGDKIGRKNAILCYIVLFSVSMFFSGLAKDAVMLGLWRFLTGCGVGGTLVNVTSLVTEYVPTRSRATTVSVIYSGTSIGAIVAALLGMWLLPHHNWRIMLLLGAIPILALPLYIKFLPESPVYLVKRGRIGQLRSYLRKARPTEPLSDDVNLEVNKGTGKSPLRAIFEEGRAFSTVLFWIVWFMNVSVLFGFTIWLPKLIMNRGYSLATGLSFLLTLSVAAIAGTFIAGYLADRFGTKPTLSAYFLISFCSVALVGYTGNYTYLMVLVSLAGACINGAQNCMNSYMPTYYPPSMRSTGTGVCYAVSRLGAVLGPMVVGVLITRNFSYRATLVALALPSLISTFGILAIQEKYSFARKLEQEQVSRQVSPEPA
jgi:MFS transporter, AAHS family, benzoate transport protein